MIWAILPDASSTEILLNNLSEADFDLNEISVVMRDSSQRDKIAKDLGPLKGVGLKKLENELINLGMSKEGTDICQEAISRGKVLVVMNVVDEYLPAAVEMFKDHSAQMIKG